MPSISVVTPSVRPEMLESIRKCLSRQTFTDFEWIIVTPYSKEWEPLMKEFYLRDGYSTNKIRLGDKENYLLFEPPKNKGDYYGLNKAWNAAFKVAEGKLIVSIQDGLWFPPDLLEQFWQHYQDSPRSLVSAIGHQYDEVENGKPEHRVWTDPRSRTDFGSFYEVEPSEIEFCVASIPKQALYDVGGIDEEYDKFAALAEKELCYRIQQLGYTFWLDQSIEYRAIKHPRLSPEWEERYQAGCKVYANHLQEIRRGSRLKLDFLS